MSYISPQAYEAVIANRGPELALPGEVEVRSVVGFARAELTRALGKGITDRAEVAAAVEATKRRAQQERIGDRQFLNAMHLFAHGIVVGGNFRGVDNLHTARIQRATLRVMGQVARMHGEIADELKTFVRAERTRQACEDNRQLVRRKGAGFEHV